MPSFLDRDYSKYPEPIRETFPYVAGETCELRQAWSVYHRLFMDDQRLMAVMSERLGRLLGLVQTTTQEAMFLSIARLTDKDNRSQPKLAHRLYSPCSRERRRRGFVEIPQWQRPIRGSSPISSFLRAVAVASAGA